MSQVIVLDTHIWFWWMTQEFGRFPSHWQEGFETAEQVGVSAISCYEIALAQQRGRLELPCLASEWFQEALEPAGISIFPLTPAIAYLLQLPNELIEQAQRLAAEHQTPLNQWLLDAIAQRIEAERVTRLLQPYAEKLDEDRFSEILARVSDVAPLAGDELE